ncbi:MAG: amino acid adenylation domain-containing protein [Gammaproteobacteria bacterium]|nr:amino acid adenylation domain-containing protein [Gammaproteobacteria bacterium]
MSNIKASPYSKLFYREWLLDPARSDYNIVFDQTIIGSLDVARLKQALQRFIAEHIIFNSHLLDDNDELYWVKNGTIFLLEYFDQPIDQHHYVAKPFNLTSGPLYRFGIFNEGPQCFRLILIFHHVLIDGGSFPECIRLISEYYNNDKMSLPDHSKTLIHIAQLLEKKLQKLENENAECFWKTVLNDLPESNNLPYYKSSVNLQSNVVKEYCFTIVAEECTSIDSEFMSFSKHNLFILVWGILIARYGNQHSAYISYPVSIKEGEALRYGAHVNTLILPINLSEHKTFRQLYNELSQFVKNLKINDSLKYSYLPTEQIIRSGNIGRLTVGFAQTDLKNVKLSLNQCEIVINHDYNIDIGGSELLLDYEISQGKINFRLRFLAELFQQWQMVSVAEQYHLLLKEVLEKPDISLRNHNLLSKKQYDEIVYEWNRNTVNLYKNFTIITLFESQVEDTPNKVALLYDDKKITYRELNEKSNQLARYIRRKYLQITKTEFQPDTLIAIGVERSLDLIIGMLAILKAGGAYVPINLNYPIERISYILEDTQSKVVLTQQDFISKLGLNENAILATNSSFMALDIVDYQNEERTNLFTDISPQNLAYVIYTSGTTGKPKGVMIEHHSVITLVKNSGYIDIGKDDVFIQLANPVFDAATFEIWGPLLNGAQLMLPEPGLDLLSNIDLFKTYLTVNKISIFWLTKTLFDSLYQADKNIFAGIRYLLVGGEALNATLIKELSVQKTGPQYLLNVYGLTETTTFSTTYQCNNSDYSSVNVPIGKPFNNIKAYVLDSALNPLPVGVVGELYIGGAGLARGYLNLPKLTAERFIANPFASTDDSAENYLRIYKTGDLVRWLPDGSLECLGRNDLQVKIRGHRVELSEIESVLSTYPALRQAIVLAKQHNVVAGLTVKTGHFYLVGYYVSEKKLDENDILAYLSDKLPPYMLPSILIHLDKMPVTVSGKLDTKLLPEPSFLSIDCYVEPTGVLEKQVAMIWSDILGLPKDSIGSNDDFFGLGGDSILSIQLSFRLSSSGYNCQVKDIYKYPELKKLANYLSHSSKVEINAEQGTLAGALKLLPIQRWFFDNVKFGYFKKYNHFNQSFSIIIPEIEIAKLKNIMKSLAMQHDVLRACYRFDKQTNCYQQYYQNVATIPPINLLNISSDLPQLNLPEEIEAHIAKWQSNFNIVTGPLWQVSYLSGYKDGFARLFFAFHHLIIDAVSWRILLEDIKALCEGRKLLPKTSSYRQWANAINSYANEQAQEISYWIKQYDDIPKYEELRSAESDTTCTAQKFSLTSRQTNQLLHDINSTYDTQINDILLVALTGALQKTFAGNIHGITLEGHGRENIFEGLDVSRTVGWFTTLYPIRLELKETLEESIKHIKRTLRLIPAKGIGFGALKYNAATTNLLQDFSLPPISFNYLGQFDNNADCWKITGEVNKFAMHVENKSPNLIDIVGLVSNGQLSFTIFSCLSKAETITLATRFRSSLIDIIQHCLLHKKNEALPPFTYMQSYFFKYAAGKSCKFSVVLPLVMPTLDVPQLKAAIKKVITNHDVFSIRYKKINNQWMQHTGSNDCMFVLEGSVSLSHVVSKVKSLAELIDITSGPVLICYVCVVNKEHHAIFITHHLYLDRTSFAIFINHLNAFYLQTDLEVNAIKPYGFLDWASDISHYPVAKHTEEINLLWNRLSNYSDGVFMDKQSTDAMPENYSTKIFYLDSHFIEKSNAIKNTIPTFNLLFITLFLTSFILKESPEITIDCVFLGRDLQQKVSRESLENTIGWLATNVPVRLKVQQAMGAVQDDGLTKDIILALNEQLLAFIKQGNDVLYEAAMSHSEFNLIEKSSVLFNYYNASNIDDDKQAQKIGPHLSPIQSHLPVMYMEHVDYNMALTVSKNKNNILLNLYFNQLNYHEQTMISFIETYKRLAERIVDIIYKPLN